MSLNQVIKDVLAETDYQNNPYFLTLQNGAFDKDDFIETQIQFYFAVVFFARPMAALAAKIPSSKLRVEVLRNVWEEHGEGRLCESHGATFVELLNRLNKISMKDVQSRALWPEVRIFNACLVGTTVLDDYLVGVAMMGMIERMFSDISALISKGIISRGWLNQEMIVHYKLHHRLDIRHSDDFFSILSDSYVKSKQNQYLVEQGLRLGATLFNNLYLGLWNARARRWLLGEPLSASRSADFIP